MTLPLTRVAALLVLVSLTACGDSPGDEGDACSGDEDCASPLVCIINPDGPTGLCQPAPEETGDTGS